MAFKNNYDGTLTCTYCGDMVYPEEAPDHKCEEDEIEETGIADWNGGEFYK